MLGASMASRRHGGIASMASRRRPAVHGRRSLCHYGVLSRCPSFSSGRLGRARLETSSRDSRHRLRRYTNEGPRPTYVGITSSVPAEVVALDLETYDVVHARRGSFMSALGRGNAGFECDCNPLTCCCAGFGMCRQTISGAPGTAFVQATGTVERKALKSGETLVVDSYSLVAWHDATLGVRPVGTCGACCCGGEGCCYTTITGPGTAWVQSMPWELYRRHMGVVVQLDKNGNVKGVS